MSPIAPRCLLLVAALIALAGCSSNRPCFEDATYQQAVDNPPLRLPADATASERIAPMVIPRPAANVAKLNPEPRCIDEPPQFSTRKAAATPAAAGAVGSAAAGGPDPAAVAVGAWAMAWSKGKASTVQSFYSKSYRESFPGGDDAFRDDLRKRIEASSGADAQLEDLTVREVAPDRRVATFVQRVGDRKVRKELELVKEPRGWYIVKEREL